MERSVGGVGVLDKCVVVLDALIDGESPFHALPELMPRLADATQPALCHRLRYDEQA